MTICFYCGKRDTEPRFSFKTKVYKKIDSNLGIGLTGIKRTTRYYEKDIEIERCGSCYSEHHKANRPALIYSIIALVISGPVAYYFALRVYIAIIAAIVCALVTMIVYFSFVYRKHIKSLGIKDQHETDKHPQVKELLDSGWQLMKP
jgi:hypothetical protein